MTEVYRSVGRYISTKFTRSLINVGLIRYSSGVVLRAPLSPNSSRRLKISRAG